MKPIPYGNANYYSIRERDHLYIDRTQFIRILEEMNIDRALFIRPRMFGKDDIEIKMNNTLNNMIAEHFSYYADILQEVKFYDEAINTFGRSENAIKKKIGRPEESN